MPTPPMDNQGMLRRRLPQTQGRSTPQPPVQGTGMLKRQAPVGGGAPPGGPQQPGGPGDVRQIAHQQWRSALLRKAQQGGKPGGGMGILPQGGGPPVEGQGGGPPGEGQGGGDPQELLRNLMRTRVSRRLTKRS